MKIAGRTGENKGVMVSQAIFMHSGEPEAHGSCARDDMSFRVKRSGARSDFRTPVESIGLQKPEKLLLVAALGRAVFEAFESFLPTRQLLRRVDA